jgi:hypothetical protein
MLISGRDELRRGQTVLPCKITREQFDQRISEPGVESRRFGSRHRQKCHRDETKNWKDPTLGHHWTSTSDDFEIYRRCTNCRR